MANVPSMSASKGKDIAVIATVIIVVVLIAYIALKFGKLFGGLIKGAGVGLGVQNSDDKANVNSVYDSGNSPLFSYTFPKMQADPRSKGAPLLTVAQIDVLIAKLQSYRGTFFDDGEKAVGLFAGLGTKFKVAWFAYRFQIRTGNELFNWLRKSDTLFAQGFNAQIVNDIIKTVDALPTF